MATIGPKELQRRDMRENKPKPRAAAKIAPPTEAAEKPEPTAPANPADQAAPAPQAEESNVRAKKTAKRGTQTRTAVKGKTAAKIDRSPRAVGDFIVAGGKDGVAMADLEKKFGIDAHPMRSKIHAARHELKFRIEYDSKTSRYVGSAPRQKAVTA